MKFSPDGQFVVSRDYLTMKIWDSRMERQPFKLIKFHNHLIPKLCDLYENDCIFDKFECAWSGNSMYKYLTYLILGDCLLDLIVITSLYVTLLVEK